MTKLIGALTFCGLAALMSCDNGGASTSGRLSDDDCPIGTFKPEGLTDCVFPADDQFGNLLGVSDNRCSSGQPAFPPICASDTGGRPYLSTTKTCASGYRFQPGACQRGNGSAGTTGQAGTTGFATGFAGNSGQAGDFGEAGTIGTGFGTGFAGDAAGVTGAAGAN